MRGRLVKRLGELIGEHKQALADLVTIEVGKIGSEALGEVQEMIDICDLAVGLSRQLFGRTMPSERSGHRLQEVWHPLGVVGVISAFNFPVAVWSWNAAVALVCGDTVVWKPSELAPLTALATSSLLARAVAEVGAPPAVGGLVLGGRESARRSSTPRRSPSSAPPARPGWAVRWARGWRPGSDACCSNSAATTPSCSPRPPTSTWP